MRRMLSDVLGFMGYSVTTNQSEDVYSQRKGGVDDIRKSDKNISL